MTITGTNIHMLDTARTDFLPSTGAADGFANDGLLPLRVMIGDNECKIISQSETKIECRIPRGYGNNQPVRVERRLDNQRVVRLNQDSHGESVKRQAIPYSIGTHIASGQVYSHRGSCWRANNEIVSDDNKEFVKTAFTHVVCAGKEPQRRSQTTLLESNDFASTSGPGSMLDDNGFPFDYSISDQVADDCFEKPLVRGTPCGLVSCECMRDSYNMFAPIADFNKFVYHYDNPVLLEVGAVHQALDGTDGGYESGSVLRSKEGEDGGVNRGQPAALPFKHVTGIPAGGEWIMVTARNLPHDNGMEQASELFKEKTRLEFGRMLDYQENDENKNKKFNIQDIGDYWGANPARGNQYSAGNDQRLPRQLCTDMVLIERETATTPARFMCRTPPGCDVVNVNIVVDAKSHDDCNAQATDQTSCQDVKFKYVEPYVCDWYEPHCGTIKITGRNFPGRASMAKRGNLQATNTAIDADVILQEYNPFTNTWSDRARCTNLAHDEHDMSTDSSVVGKAHRDDDQGTPHDTLPIGGTNGNAGFRGNGFEESPDEWEVAKVYLPGTVVKHEGSCYVAKDIDMDHPFEPRTGEEHDKLLNVGKSPKLVNSATVGDTSRYWEPAFCYRNQFTCRLPAVFWARNSANRYDSDVHKRFRFRVRGCYLQDAAFYSGSDSQRQCIDDSDYEKKPVGFVGGYDATHPDSVIVDSWQTVNELKDNTKTRMVLSTMTIEGPAGSYFDKAWLMSDMRHKLAKSMADHLDLQPYAIKFERTYQEGAHVNIDVAIVTDEEHYDSTFSKMTSIGSDIGNDLKEAFVVKNVPNQPKSVGRVSFNMIRDVANGKGTWSVLTSRVQLQSPRTAEIANSQKFRDSFKESVAAAVQTTTDQVKVTAVYEAEQKRRRLTGRNLADESSAIMVEFTVITDVTGGGKDPSAVSNMLNQAMNDGTFLKHLNSLTALDFETSKVATTASSAAGADDETDYEKPFWAMLGVSIVLLLVSVGTLLYVCLRGKDKKPAGGAPGLYEMN
jgi:hypothetical protein